MYSPAAVTTRMNEICMLHKLNMLRADSSWFAHLQLRQDYVLVAKSGDQAREMLVAKYSMLQHLQFVKGIW